MAIMRSWHLAVQVFPQFSIQQRAIFFATRGLAGVPQVIRNPFHKRSTAPPKLPWQALAVGISTVVSIGLSSFMLAV
jgi:hypothetical protein